MVVSKHFTHFCYSIELALYQHLNSHVAYAGIPLKIQKTHVGNTIICHRTLLSDYSDHSIAKLLQFRMTLVENHLVVSELVLLDFG